MIPQQNVKLERTQNDTGLLYVTLSVKNDLGVAAVVADTTVVTLHIKAATTVVITGIAKGDGSGTFTFNPDPKVLADIGNCAFDIKIIPVGGERDTIGSGVLINHKEVP